MSGDYAGALDDALHALDLRGEVEVTLADLD